MKGKKVPEYKQGVNNELISMKSKIRQAKIRTISALLRKLKTAKQSLEKQPDSAKFSSQVQRLSEQFEFLKHSNIQKLGLAMLSVRKTPNQITSTPEDVCAALLLKCTDMNERMAAIREKFHLDDSIEWREVVTTTGIKKLRKEKKARKEKLNTTEEQGKVSKDKNPVENADLETNGEITDKPTKSNAKKSTGDKPKNANNSNTDSVSSVSNKLGKKTNKKGGNEQAAVQETSVDPFFITEDGANYVAVMSRNPNQSTNDDDDDKEVRPGRQFSKTQKPKMNNKQAFNKTIKLKTNQPSEEDPNVHPSWSAKRKQKALPSFQGKKIKFGNDDDTVSTSTSKKPADSSDLHPSWAAKQKLKPTIAEFKGSKITFDDD